MKLSGGLYHAHMCEQALNSQRSSHFGEHDQVLGGRVIFVLLGDTNKFSDSLLMAQDLVLVWQRNNRPGSVTQLNDASHHQLWLLRA